METKDRTDKYIKAKKQVENIKGFYKHAAFYIVINLFFIGRRIYKDIEYGDSVFEAFTEISNYRLFFWWTLILIFHGISTFQLVNLLFGKNWEQRKIKEEMNKQNNL
jgi:hypothetical protein